MRYKFSLSTTAFFLSTLVYLSGCTKKISLLPPTSSDIPCRISLITSNTGENGVLDTLYFTYNAAGNPSLIRQSQILDAGSYEFIYDSHNTLVQYKVVYTEFNASGWTIFQFPRGSDQPDTDITYQFPSPDTGSLPPAFYTNLDTTAYRYDSQKRISQTVTTYADNEGNVAFTTTYNYSYDNRGNLSSPIFDDTTAGRAYDDKVNFRRLNPIFQFIDRDYSQNNLTTQIQILSYNQYGLPTHMKDTSPIGTLTFLGIGLGECWIQYDCSCGIKTTVPLKDL